MHKEEKTLSNTCNTFNVQNLFVSKDKASDFFGFYYKELEDIDILRLIPSGNYYIITFDIDSSEQRDLLKEHENDWL